jgi:hypothetical protein
MYPYLQLYKYGSGKFNSLKLLALLEQLTSWPNSIPLTIELISKVLERTSPPPLSVRKPNYIIMFPNKTLLVINTPKAENKLPTYYCIGWDRKIILKGLFDFNTFKPIKNNLNLLSYFTDPLLPLRYYQGKELAEANLPKELRKISRTPELRELLKDILTYSPFLSNDCKFE